MKRRDFLKKAAIPTTALAVDQALKPMRNAGLCKAAAPQSPAIAGTLPQREYGKTGIKLSVLGFGGYMLADMPQSDANRLVADAVSRGVNYFDVAPTYKNAEQLLGPALGPFRKKVFLACKTTERKRDGAMAELTRSLERLRTDHFDLYQLHGINDVKKDVDTAFAKGGAMEVLLEAKKAGVVRHLGFSAHTVDAALTALDRYDFDSVLFPVNFACYYAGSFGPQVVAKAKEKNAAILAIKAMARQKWPKNDPTRKKYPNCWYQPLTDPDETLLGLRFTLSQPITAAIPPADPSLFRYALQLADRLTPIAKNELATLKSLTANLTPIFSTA